ncbi:MAG: hypothetical protein V3V62_01825 [bacterium]
MVDLRAYVFLDTLQEQLASYIGTTARGFLPLGGQASLFVEVAPGMEVNRLMDVALKATRVQPSMMVVERAFGSMELHSDSQGEVRQAGEAVLSALGAEEAGRRAPRVVSRQLVRRVDPHQAQIINRQRYGSMLIPGQTLFILEVEPAAYIALAANEAEKASAVTLVDVRLFGAYGRLYLGGEERDVEVGSQAALAAVEGIEGRAE